MRILQLEEWDVAFTSQKQGRSIVVIAKWGRFHGEVSAPIQNCRSPREYASKFPGEFDHLQKRALASLNRYISGVIADLSPLISCD